MTIVLIKIKNENKQMYDNHNISNSVRKQNGKLTQNDILITSPYLGTIAIPGRTMLI